MPGPDISGNESRVRVSTMLTVNTINTIISTPSGMAEGCVLLLRGRKNRAHRQSCWR